GTIAGGVLSTVTMNAVSPRFPTASVAVTTTLFAPSASPGATTAVHVNAPGVVVAVHGAARAPKVIATGAPSAGVTSTSSVSKPATLESRSALGTAMSDGGVTSTVVVVVAPAVSLPAASTSAPVLRSSSPSSASAGTASSKTTSGPSAFTVVDAEN